MTQKTKFKRQNQKKETGFTRRKINGPKPVQKQTSQKKRSGFTVRKISSPVSQGGAKGSSSSTQQNRTKGVRQTQQARQTQQRPQVRPTQQKPQPQKIKPKKIQQPRLRVIPLGGCEEVGRNMTVFEYGNDIIIVDMGLQFPEENMPGIDYIIPNTSYLKGKEQNIRGVIFTHGHLDHIGAAPILLGRLGNPLVVGGKLTVHMIKARQEDYQKGSANALKIKAIESTNETLKLGQFTIKFFPVSHSIIDSLGVIIETPVITLIHPGDWKLEHDPIGKPIDYKALGKLKKPTALMLESLGVSYNKAPVSEKEMNKNLETIITTAPGRVIIGTFSSMIERIKVVLEIAERLGKRVAVDGFSMKTSVEIAKKLGYIKFNLKNLIDIRQAGKVPNNKLIIICTGAQGEENAVLARIASGDHRTIKFQKNDTVIFSSSVIPGNERTVQHLKDEIYRQSDNVIHSEIMDVHSGGHATAADVEEVIKQISPTYFIPIYANHYMLKEAAKLARKQGYKDENIFIPDNGSVIEFTKNTARLTNEKVNTSLVIVDGLGIGDVGNIVLRDRQAMAEDGMLVVIVAIDKNRNLVNRPDIISRGFVYMKSSEELMKDIKTKVAKIVADHTKKSPKEKNWSPLRARIRDELGQFLFSKTERRPMILPVVIEV